MICSQIVSAQDKNLGQNSIEESDKPAPEIENPVPVSSSFPPLRDIDKPNKINWRAKKNELPETSDKFSAITGKSEIEDSKYNFRAIDVNERSFDFRGAAIKDFKKYPFPQQTLAADSKNKAKEDETGKDDETEIEKSDGFNWRSALNQSFMFLGVQHGYAILGQKKTRQALKGNFWGDYVDSVKSLRGWSDGGRFFTNYIAHPMQGSLTGFIYVQNSPQARRQQFGMSGDYWRSRMKAMLWTTAWSTQFEIGPISQASIGNVGWSGKQTWEDIVTTPTIGTAMLITEDAIDRYLIKSIERRTNNFYIKIFSRMIFNPTRVFANLLRLKEPWYRDRPTAH